MTPVFVITFGDVLDVLEEALAQPSVSVEQSTECGEPVANGKLKVTLQDTPTEIELAQYKKMLQAACADLGAINEALGLDPNDGGAESILFAIEELRGRSQEPMAWMVYTLDGTSVCVTDNPKSFTPEHRALPLYTTPPQRKPQIWEHEGYDALCQELELWKAEAQRKPLTDEEIYDMYNEPRSDAEMIAFARAIEAAHQIYEDKK